MHSAYSVSVVGAPSRRSTNDAPFFQLHLSAMSFGSSEYCRKIWPFGASRQSSSSTPARCTQPSSSLHVSNVQTSPSSHSVSAPPVQTPAVHFSPLVHASLSWHALLFGSAVEQLSAASLHVSAQLLSLSGPGQGSP